jgi:DNA-binding winged helix-turn-helix (wHTH) protein
LDTSSGELRKNGLRIRIEDQPFRLLLALLERPGELITREELSRTIWQDRTFVDFERSLSRAVNKVRTALGDSAANPRFIETLPRRGYRFTAPVTIISTDSESLCSVPGGSVPDQPRTAAGGEPPLGPRTKLLSYFNREFTVIAAFVALAALILTALAPKPALTVAVLPFQDFFGNPAEIRFSEADDGSVYRNAGTNSLDQGRIAEIGNALQE